VRGPERAIPREEASRCAEPSRGYRERIPDRVGLYRAVAVRETLNAGADICARDRSPTVRYRH